ncbi:amidohydrolase family protein [Candidatus Bathyarchaeota archaeon]|nr:amidohydrolase family protein [Candidatus Bathyarchaeota archaeon]
MLRGAGKIFLFHYHVFPLGMLDKSNPKRGTVDELVEILERLGIEKVAVFPVFNFPEARPFASPEFDPDKWIYEVLREKGYRNIYPFIIVNPKDGWSAIQTLRDYLNKGFVGVKIHPPIYKIRVNDPAFHQFYYTCEELQVPVVFHTGVFRHWKLKYYRPLLLDEVAQEYPQMPIILAHTGGAAFFREALAVIQNNPNCYAELSGTLNPNSPWHIPEEDLLLIRLVGSSGSSMERIPIARSR